jgi:hypothetical protein
VSVSEKDAREAAQVLVVLDEFFSAHWVCRICCSTDDMLVSGKAP